MRFANAAHAALRNAFNAVGTIMPDAAQRAAVRPFLLERAAEARGC